MFRPRSIAVVGASRRRHSVGREILENLMEGEFQGPVYAVNRSAEVVRSLRAYDRVTKIPDDVEMAVIAVPRDAVQAVAADCAKKGVKALVVITAGFREAGPEGERAEQRLAALVKRAGMRVIGPNCMGVIQTDPAVRMNATFAASTPLPGKVAFATQSGALGEAILADARDLGLGISAFASVGNIVDVTVPDLVEYLGADPRTGLVLLYLESFGEPERFKAIARALTRRKPIVVVKSGRSAAGARAAVSHTGSLAGRDLAAESLLEQCGVLRARSVAEMFDIAAALANQPVPEGDRVAIVSNAGGPGILATDAVMGLGLTLARYGARTRRRLAACLPEGVAPANPTDLIADAGAERFDAALRAVGRDPGVDAILCLFVSPVITDSLAVARAIAAATGKTARTTLACFMGKGGHEEGVQWLRRAGVPVYRFPEEAAAALAAMCRYRRLRERPEGRTVRFRADFAAARRVIATARKAGRDVLLGREAEALFAAYGFPVARSRVAADVGEALAFAADVGYPVVLKAESRRFVHKTEVGGVRTGLRDARQLTGAYRDMERRLRARADDLKLRVQAQVPGHAEVILGASHDPVFGTILLFGLGGVFVEVLRDTATRVAPITDVDAREMIRSIRGWPVLAGVRGGRPVDVKFLEEAVLRLAQLVADHPEILELDVNPLIVGARRAQCAVVDARVRLRGAGDAP